MKSKKTNKDQIIRNITVYGSEYDFFMTSVEIAPAVSAKKKRTELEKPVPSESKPEH